MVSVIIPVYNTSAYLSRCIDSVLAQTYPDWRLWLIDDGSTDGSLEICNAYAAKDVRISVISKPNGGAADSRNVGIDHADTEFITFCDSDDTLHPDYLRRLMQHNDGCDCVICEMKDIYETHTGGVHIIEFEYLKCDDPYKCEEFLFIFLCGLFNSPCNKLYRSSIIKQNDIRFDKEVYNEDVTFNVEYFRHCHGVKIITEQLYNYYHRRNSITHSVPERAFNDYINLQEKLLSLVDKKHHRYINNFVSHQYIGMVLRFMRKGQTDVALRYLKHPSVKLAMKDHIPYSKMDRIQSRMLRYRMLKLYSLLFLR